MVTPEPPEIKEPAMWLVIGLFLLVLGMLILGVTMSLD